MVRPKRWYHHAADDGNGWCAHSPWRNESDRISLAQRTRVRHLPTGRSAPLVEGCRHVGDGRVSQQCAAPLRKCDFMATVGV
jgi:hypothetical protein